MPKAVPPEIEVVVNLATEIGSTKGGEVTPTDEQGPPLNAVQPRWVPGAIVRPMSQVVVRNEARAALIEGALAQLATLGPVRVHPNEICAALGLSKALVNYHFGNREGLVLEAMALGYERYVDHLAAASEAGPSAVDRLFAWIDAQVDWTSANPGLAAVLDFPTVFSGGDAPNVAGVDARLAAAGRRNFDNLQRLVGAARTELRPGEAPLAATEVGLDGAVVGWLTLGLSVWKAGQHRPTQGLGSAERLPVARAHLRALVVQLLSR